VAFLVEIQQSAASMPRATLALALLPLLCGALGCRERRGPPLQRSDAVASASAPPRSAPVLNLFTSEALNRLMSAIRERVGDATSVLMLELTAERATIQVEAPAHPGTVVQFEWGDGTLRGPIPVELRGAGALENNLFPLSSIDVGPIPELAKAAVERIDREHGQVERIVVRRNLPVEEAVGIRVYVKSPIRSSHVDADARGRIAENPRLP
jgi:hypothetical protein